jgi:hypothetical protein
MIDHGLKTLPRLCLVCLDDLADEMGCYVWVGGKSAPDDVIVCIRLFWRRNPDTCKDEWAFG